MTPRTRRPPAIARDLAALYALRRPLTPAEGLRFDRLVGECRRALRRDIRLMPTRPYHLRLQVAFQDLEVSSWTSAIALRTMTVAPVYAGTAIT